MFPAIKANVRTIKNLFGFNKLEKKLKTEDKFSDWVGIGTGLLGSLLFKNL
jgi:hypothetical protein